MVRTAAAGWECRVGRKRGTGGAQPRSAAAATPAMADAAATAAMGRRRRWRARRGRAAAARPLGAASSPRAASIFLRRTAFLSDRHSQGGVGGAPGAGGAPGQGGAKGAAGKRGETASPGGGDPSGSFGHPGSPGGGGSPGSDGSPGHLGGLGLKGITAGDSSATLIAADRLVLVTVPPGHVKAEESFTIVVRAEDGLGRLDSAFSGNVSVRLANNPSSANLNGLLTVRAWHATFNGLNADKVGTLSHEVSRSECSDDRPGDVKAAGLSSQQPPLHDGRNLFNRRFVGFSGQCRYELTSDGGRSGAGPDSRRAHRAGDPSGGGYRTFDHLAGGGFDDASADGWTSEARTSSPSRRQPRANFCRRQQTVHAGSASVAVVHPATSTRRLTVASR